MDKSRVYIGVYIENNQESLFYQKDINKYYDLKQKKNVSLCELQSNCLVPYKDIIKCCSNIKRNIIKLYDLDRMKKVSLDRLFIGNIYQITEIVSQEYYGTNLWDAGVNTEFKVSLQNENILLLALSKDKKNTDFRNMENGTEYKNLFIPNLGDFYVSNKPQDLRLASIELSINSKEIEKGKLLEKYREYKRR